MNPPPACQHPRPRCQFGRPHQWTCFVHLDGHYACTVCGIEDDDQWWDEHNRWIGPANVPRVDLDEAGWALRLT